MFIICIFFLLKPQSRAAGDRLINDASQLRHSFQEEFILSTNGQQPFCFWMPPNFRHSFFSFFFTDSPVDASQHWCLQSAIKLSTCRSLPVLNVQGLDQLQCQSSCDFSLCSYLTTFQLTVVKFIVKQREKQLLLAQLSSYCCTHVTETPRKHPQWLKSEGTGSPTQLYRLCAFELRCRRADMPQCDVSKSSSWIHSVQIWESSEAGCQTCQISQRHALKQHPLRWTSSVWDK